MLAVGLAFTATPARADGDVLRAVGSFFLGDRDDHDRWRHYDRDDHDRWRHYNRDDDRYRRIACGGRREQDAQRVALIELDQTGDPVAPVEADLGGALAQ